MKHNNVRQILFPILAALIWGTAFVAQDLCADVIDTFSFNAARSYIAVVVLLVIIFIFDKLKKDKVELSPAEKKKAHRDLLVGGFSKGGRYSVSLAALLSTTTTSAPSALPK